MMENVEATGTITKFAVSSRSHKLFQGTVDIHKEVVNGQCSSLHGGIFLPHTTTNHVPAQAEVANHLQRALWASNTPKMFILTFIASTIQYCWCSKTDSVMMKEIGVLKQAQWRWKRETTNHTCPLKYFLFNTCYTKNERCDFFLLKHVNQNHMLVTQAWKHGCTSWYSVR